MQRTAHPIRSLADSLQELNKEDLHRIRKTLDVKKASSLNKTDLVQYLSEEILVKLEYTLGLFDMRRFQLIQRVIEAGGSIPLEEIFEDEYVEPGYFQDYGLLFTDWKTRIIYMPVEVEKRLKRVDQVWLRHILRRNTEWTQLTAGLLYYYGTVSIRQMLELLGRYTDRAEYLEYYAVIQDYAAYDNGISLSASGISHYKVTDPEQVRYEHELRPTIDYYPFTKEQVLRAAADDYIDRTAEYHELVRYLRQQWVMDTEEAEIILEEIFDHIQNGSMPGDMIEYLQSEVELRDLHQIQQLTDRIIRYMNHTRQWYLKGYSPSELREASDRAAGSHTQVSAGSRTAADIYDFHTGKKIGRNDPCPCGSGKKFKKCCGSN